MKIGIIGGGFVGKATNLLRCKDITTFVYDIQPELCNPLSTSFEDVLRCEIIFICVPTPSRTDDNSCDTSIVEKVVEKLKSCKFPGQIFIRSTTIPGTAERLQVNHMPEFLTEANWEHDFRTCRNWVFGVIQDSQKTKDAITKMMKYALDNKCIQISTRVELHFVSPTEAECVKYFRNTFLATKVSLCNEFYDYCQKKNVTYETVRKIMTTDPRIGPSHTFVPHNKKFGFGGSCLPKDTKALCQDGSFLILEAVLKQNDLDVIKFCE